MANLISFIILIFFLYGRSLWKTRLKQHILIMVTVIAADTLLILGLVESRDALGKVGADMPLILKVHVPIAVLTFLLYFPTAWAGYQLYSGNASARARLRFFDRILVPARILTLVTSLLVQFLKT